VYFAGPLFNETEMAFNARLAALIEDAGFDVYLPQRDGYEPGAIPGPITGATAQKIFDLDLEHVLACDVLLCVLDGRVPDEGMAVEIGLAYADRIHEHNGRKLIGYTTDWRHGRGDTLNPMLLGALDEIHHDETALLDRLHSLIAG
jgi:nucleoside 2-deoxyribosyltransferase